ncbi:hypothetical protein WJX73_007433 [Symbiochloris irregularis]|uniref:IFT80/172/WDR35 TPR domain-containing protein n=1 Tax=Symbiochloris irregularis TaxID=706552 RepID=A0AAW1P9Q5_9CHLO
MRCHHLETYLPAALQLQPIAALAWGPDRQRIAAATSDRTISVFSPQGVRLDKFKTKPADTGSGAYSIRGLAWSPDSTLLAVAQSDGAIFGFRLGRLDSQEKKAICWKVLFKGSPTSIVWLPGDSASGVIFGCLDGQVCSALLGQSKAAVVGQAQPVLNLAVAGQAVWSAHQDGWICRVQLASAAGKAGSLLQRLVRHCAAPEALAATDTSILAAGPDLKVHIYSHTGSYAMSHEAEVKHMHTAAALAWHPDGGRLWVGTVAGSLEAFQTCSTCLRYGESFQVEQHAAGGATIASLKDGSTHGLVAPDSMPIHWLEVFRGRYVVAFTASALLLLDWDTGASSHVPWKRAGDECFCLDWPLVCIIHSQGSLSRSGAAESQGYSHTTDVDFVELSREATHVLFRDTNSNLHAPDDVQQLQVEGEVQHLTFAQGEAQVVATGPHGTQHVTLDRELISLGSALAAKHLTRALGILGARGQQGRLKAQWGRAADLAIETMDLTIAADCASAAGDAVKADFLRQTVACGNAEQAARIAQLAGHWQDAEAAYLQAGQPSSALQMYKDAHKWDDAIRLAATIGQDVGSLQEEQLQWLIRSDQQVAAGELWEKRGGYAQAMALYLDAAAPMHAAKLVLSNRKERFEAAHLERVAEMLESAGLYEDLGEFLEGCHMTADAVNAYQRGHAYQQAATLAGQQAPALLVAVEGAWGAWLAGQGKQAEAISHLVAGGQHEAALQAASGCRNWQAASDILASMDPQLAQAHALDLAKRCADQGALAAAEGFLSTAGRASDSVALWLGEGMWSEAHAAAVRAKMPQEALQEVVTAEGARLEEQGRLQDAEALFLAFDDPDAALAMWHSHHRFTEAVELVARVRPDQLSALHSQLGRQLVEEGDVEGAEVHFLAASDWQAAAAALQEAGLWEEALRVAHEHGGDAAEDEVAFAWMQTLGLARGGRELQERGLVGRVVAHAVRTQQYEAAGALAQVAGDGDMAAWAHHQHALALQQQDKHAAAEAAFVASGQPGDAVEMYVSQGDLEAARRLAEQWQLDSLPDILAAQAQAAADAGDLAAAEGLWLHAGLPHQALDMYSASGHWAEALSFARNHLPQQAEGLELEAKAAEPGLLSMAGQARLREAHAALAEEDALAAAHALLGITRQDSADCDFLSLVWHRAVSLGRTQGHIHCMEVVRDAAGQLVHIGRPAAAAELLASINDRQEAVAVCMDAQLFTEAKDLARGNAILQQAVQEAEAAYLMQHGDADELAAAGYLSEAVDMYEAEGRWEQAHTLASSQGSEHALACSIRHATSEAEAGNAASRAHQGDLETSTLQDVWEAVHLTVQHRHSVRTGQVELAAKQATARLRLLAHLPSDRAFYEAGEACRSAAKGGMALAFFNRYLDISEGIDDGDHDGAGGLNDFRMFTGIPTSAPLPPWHYAAEHARDEVREWTLSASMDASVQLELPQVPCPVCQRPMYEASLRCLACRSSLTADTLTGYPITEGLPSR